MHDSFFIFHFRIKAFYLAMDDIAGLTVGRLRRGGDGEALLWHAKLLKMTRENLVANLDTTHHERVGSFRHLLLER